MADYLPNVNFNRRGLNDLEEAKNFIQNLN